MWAFDYQKATNIRLRFIILLQSISFTKKITPHVKKYFAPYN